jgi:hypothetical protein
MVWPGCAWRSARWSASLACFDHGIAHASGDQLCACERSIRATSARGAGAAPRSPPHQPRVGAAVAHHEGTQPDGLEDTRREICGFYVRADDPAGPCRRSSSSTLSWTKQRTRGLAQHHRRSPIGEPCPGVTWRFFDGSAPTLRPTGACRRRLCSIAGVRLEPISEIADERHRR